MTDDIVSIIARYGLETILIAVLVNVLTALIKLPIKYLANKTKNSTRITRFIVVLPLIIGFALTVGYMEIVTDKFTFGKEFVTLWLTSSSLSLTIYAVLEKMMPSKKSILKDSETEMTEKLLGKLQSIADGVFNKDEAKLQEPEAQADASIQADEEPQAEHAIEQNAIVSKIVLRGNANVQDESQK